MSDSKGTSVPATFAKDLCVYRATNNKPNTSDASERFSVELGEALFDALHVSPDARGSEPTGDPFSKKVAAALSAQLGDRGCSLVIEPERALNQFEQFRHVGALRDMKAEPSREFVKAWTSLGRFAGRRLTDPNDQERFASLAAEVDAAVAKESDARRILLEEVGEESLLNLDVTASRQRPGPKTPSLEIGLSLKWSLRTDRAQDCRSQGAKMASLRRGRMPHFAVVTMEPRPYMLNLLGGGSGEIDCVYHLDLPALRSAVEQTCRGRPRRRATLDTFNRLVAQRRLRDWDELVDYAATL
ncbi:NgoMIV family type II restriction endonuclease [Mumia sp. DW29H23]|uniref:NgoMIV family type II restriction endonuclease n=1 Tax=Mumia sp. DW29H23 TaxID=3421241 RepID=UPI003D687AEC